jgi:hypothetical protein
MYEDLIKKLRTHNGWALNKTLNEAADVIEEFQERVVASEATIKRQSDIIKAKDRDLQRIINATSRTKEEMKPKTNRDKLRAMSDYELAVYIARRTISLPDGVTCDGYVSLDKFYQLWFDWLRREVE